MLSDFIALIKFDHIKMFQPRAVRNNFIDSPIIFETRKLEDPLRAFLDDESHSSHTNARIK